MDAWSVGLDLGSTAVKAVLMSPSGRLVARASRPAPLREIPARGLAEIPLAAYRRAAEAVLRTVAEAAPQAARLTLGIASQRSSFVAWRGHDGRALGPGISWRDRRTALPWPPPGLTQAEVAARTGLRLSPHYSAGKVRRLVGSRPPADWIVAPLPSWLAWIWSGGRILACDPTLAARTLLWDLEDARWSSLLLRRFRVARSALPQVLPTRARYGQVTVGRRILALEAMIGDQQAAAYALGVRNQTGLLNLGTGAFLMAPTGARTVRAPGLLTTLLWDDGNARAFALEGTVNSAGAFLDWCRRKGWGHASRGPLPSPRASLSLPAVLPALAGTGAPRWEAEAQVRWRAAGGMPWHPRPGPDLRGAVLLAPAYRLREIWDALPAGARPRRLLVSGGLSRSRPFLQAVADLLRIPLIRVAAEDATATGAARLASGRPPGAPSGGPAVRPRDDRDAAYRRWRALL